MYLITYLIMYLITYPGQVCQHRPGSLQGLKHKLANVKSPHRRKSIHNMPVSPLARTPSPSPLTTSPTRSPSPLTLVIDQKSGVGAGSGPTSSGSRLSAGISSQIQTYNPHPSPLLPPSGKSGMRSRSPSKLQRLHPSSARNQRLSK